VLASSFGAVSQPVHGSGAPLAAGDLREVGGADAFFGQAGDGVRDFLAGQRAVEGITADGMDQGADPCLAGAMIRRRSGCGLPPSLARTSCGRSAAWSPISPTLRWRKSGAAFAMPGAITAA
jgi:hypothetical protein